MMETPVLDFVSAYARSGISRLHMPGHKGSGPLGCEAWDITELQGADSLYDASGIIAQGEANTAALFGAGRTCWSTEGSSQCVKAMVYLASLHRRPGCGNWILAGRNVHKSFVQAAGLLDLAVDWLWPEGEYFSLCACPVTPEGLDRALRAHAQPPAAVYLTSPDYLGNLADLPALAQVTHRYGSLLLVDNAHGAYLRFLTPSLHPLDAGADLACDSAHKTLAVLTGGAYLHLSPSAPQAIGDDMKSALALFGSTSPSYLIMASLDACNSSLAGDAPVRLRLAAEGLADLKASLVRRGWVLAGQEPLKLTIDAFSSGSDGPTVARALRRSGVEPEYTDPEFVVLMIS